MVKEIRIYVEGGGNDNPSRRLIRAGFSQFLDPLRQLARERGVRWEVIPCGPRPTALEKFRTAVKVHPDALVVLLVDAETRVEGTPRDHLRRKDNWNVTGLPDEQLHLMVQVVEAWLVADLDTLASYYGKGFLRNVLPKQQDVEAIPKDQLEKALDRATKKTQKRRYRKIAHCADLLALIDCHKVRQRAKHCDRLFTFLESRLTEKSP